MSDDTTIDPVVPPVVPAPEAPEVAIPTPEEVPTETAPEASSAE